MIWMDLIQGFLIGSSLIVAIGPQNLFVIKQGIQNNYVIIVCLICSIADTILIIIGINIYSIIINFSEKYIFVIKVLGSIWLTIYGIQKIIKSKDYIEDIYSDKNILKNVILTTLFLTFVNPHVYLDTIVLIGALSLNFESKFSYGVGVILSSFIFFFSLGIFSRKISTLLIKKSLWKYIDKIFGTLMIFYGLYFIFIG